MKTRILILAVATLALVGLLAQAWAAHPRDTRRTLYVPVGQKQIILEAPDDMCFLDQTVKNEGLLFRLMADDMLLKGNETLLAVFGTCNTIANIGSTGSIELLKSIGTVTWENARIGESTPLERVDYLEMHENELKDYIRNNMKAWLESYSTPDQENQQVESTVRRNDNSISLGFRADVELTDETFKTVGVVAKTTLHHAPVVVAIRSTAKHAPSLDYLHRAMDAFLAKQIALNE